MDSEYNQEHITSTKYLTVFWKTNREKNQYIPELINYAREINRQFMNGVHINNTKRWEDLLIKYDRFIKEVKGLEECLSALLDKNTYTKIKHYEHDFLLCCNDIYDELCKTVNYKLDKRDFLTFMSNNTCEGRVIVQNKFAINDLDVLATVIDNREKAKKDIIASETKKTIQLVDSDQEWSDSESNESYDDDISSYDE